MFSELLAIADRATFVQVAFSAIVAHLTAEHLAMPKSRLPGVIAFGITLPTLFCHRFAFDATFLPLLETLVRSVLLSHVVGSATSVIATGITIVVSRMRAAQERAERERQRRERDIEQQRLQAERNKPRPAPPPEPTAKEKAEAFAQKVRDEHDAEMAIIRSLPLDRDEREVLENEAKRKLLRKLRGRN